jgi:hypothetical protein
MKIAKTNHLFAIEMLGRNRKLSMSQLHLFRFVFIVLGFNLVGFPLLLISIQCISDLHT